MEEKNKHIFKVYVSNQPGVLMRITQVFSRRNFNIDALNVSPTIDKNFSYLTISAKGSDEKIEQIIKQLSKLIDVVNCFYFNTSNFISKELILIKIGYDDKQEKQLLEFLQKNNSPIIYRNENNKELIIEKTDNSKGLKQFIKQLKKNNFNIKDFIKTGEIFMSTIGEKQ